MCQWHGLCLCAFGASPTGFADWSAAVITKTDIVLLMWNSSTVNDSLCAGHGRVYVRSIKCLYVYVCKEESEETQKEVSHTQKHYSGYVNKVKNYQHVNRQQIKTVCTA
jgi:hypothetical protein